METAFTIQSPSVGDSADVFNLWQNMSTAGIIWQLGDEIGTLWRADLPDQPDEAETILQVRAGQVALVQQTLPYVLNRLESDLTTMSGQGSSSFAIDHVPSEGPRAILAAAAQYQGVDVSFGILDGVKIDVPMLDQAVQAVGRFGDQVHRAVDQLAQVETRSGGKRIALSHASWSGDLQTWWAAGATYSQRAEHEQVLKQALATRRAWINFMILTASSITRIAAVIASGPFSPIAIWTTWNYLQKVVKEMQQLKQ